MHPQLEHLMVGNMPMFIEAIKDCEHRIQWTISPRDMGKTIPEQVQSKAEVEISRRISDCDCMGDCALCQTRKTR